MSTRIVKLLQACFDVIEQEGLCSRGQLLENAIDGELFELLASIRRSLTTKQHQIGDAIGGGRLQIGIGVHHVGGELLEHILVGHDELFGRVAVGNVDQYVECLLLQLTTIVPFQYEYYAGDDAIAVFTHHLVGELERKNIKFNKF